MIKTEVFENIEKLLIYAEKNLGLNQEDLAYKRNRILEILGIDTLEEVAFSGDIGYTEPSVILSDLVGACVENGLFETYEAEKYTDSIMGELSLLPSQISEEFVKQMSDSSKSATDFLYGYCVKNNYVKKAVLDKNPRFTAENGLIITINKSKQKSGERQQRKRRISQMRYLRRKRRLRAEKQKEFAKSRPYFKRHKVLLAVFTLRVF